MCFFIIYVNDIQPINIEVIPRDEELWKDVMLLKLSKFYFTCLLPRIVNKNRPCEDDNHN